MGILLRLLTAFAPEILLLALVTMAYLVNIGQFSIFDSSQEVYFIQAAKEMAHAGQWGLPLFNHQEVLDQPPFFIWNILFVFKLLGVSLLAAKIPGLLWALSGIILIYVFAKMLFSDRLTSILSAAMLATSWGYFKMVHVAVPDLAFVSLMLLSAGLFWAWYTRIDRPQAYQSILKSINLLLGIVFGCLLLLVGPMGVLFPASFFFVFLVFSKKTNRLNRFNWRLFILSFVLMTAPWMIWVTYQDGHESFLARFLVQLPLARLGSSLEIRWGIRECFFMILKFSAVFLPWTLYTVGPFASYLARRGQRKVIDFREAPLLFLLIWTVLSLALFTQYPPLLLPPLCLITTFFLGKAIREAVVPRSFVLATEGTILIMMAMALALTVSLFQLLPDSYPQEIWQLSGQSQWLLPYKNILFPAWKLWLLPFPILLIVTGLVLFFFLSIKQYRRIIETLAISALLFCFFINGMITPIFSLPAGEVLAHTLNSRKTPESRVFVYEPQKTLRSQYARFLFTLDKLAAHPVRFIKNIETLNGEIESQKAGDLRYGLIDETNYYQMDPLTRSRLRVIKNEIVWYTSPFQLLVPSFIVPRNASLKVWDNLLLVEVLPPSQEGPLGIR